MGRVIPLVSAPTLDEAWTAYDAAQLNVMSLYRDKASTSAQRREAIINALRLHRAFTRALSRAGHV